MSRHHAAHCGRMAAPSGQLRVILVVAAFVVPRFALAQEIEPRVFVPSPIGVTFYAVAVARSTGGILTDPSLPVDNVEAEIDSSAIGVGHTFGLLGRLATAGFILPRLAGQFSGTLDGEDAAASRSGIGDLRARFSVNLIGTQALTPAEFAKRKPTTTLGVALTVSAPTGDYHPDKLINVGTNRWALKPEIGVAHPVGRWYFEAIAGAWLFGDNDDFFGGQHREQEPLASIQGHVSYTFRPRLWLAFDATYYDGGRTTIDDVLKDDRQSNSRYGLTFSLPVSRTQSLKFHWNDGASTRIGSDFTTYGIAWQYTRLP
jgi:hypothetical protein